MFSEPIHADLADLPTMPGALEALTSLLGVKSKSEYQKQIGDPGPLGFASVQRWNEWWKMLGYQLDDHGFMLLAGGDLRDSDESEFFVTAITDREILAIERDVNSRSLFTHNPAVPGYRDYGSIDHKWDPIECRVAILMPRPGEALPRLQFSHRFARTVGSHVNLRSFGQYAPPGAVGANQPRNPDHQFDALIGYSQDLAERADSAAFENERGISIAAIREKNDLRAAPTRRPSEYPDNWNIGAVVEMRRIGAKKSEWVPMATSDWPWTPSEQCKDALIELMVEWSNRCPKDRSGWGVPPLSPGGMTVQQFFERLYAVVAADFDGDLSTAIRRGTVSPSRTMYALQSLLSVYADCKEAHAQEKRIRQQEKEQENSLRIARAEEEAAAAAAAAAELQRIRGAEPAPHLITSPFDAEIVARDWMRYWGFHDAIETQAGADGGLDVIASGAIAQVKAEMKPVGRPVVQQTFGVASALGRKALVFALTGFTPEAAKWAGEHGIALFSFDLQGRPTPLNSTAKEIVAGDQNQPV